MNDSRERLIEEIAERVLRAEGCGGCGAVHGGPANCEGAPDGEAWMDQAERGMRAVLEAGACRLSTGCRVSPLRRDLAIKIDHTLLKPDATRSELKALCEEAARHEFCSVCVNPAYVAYCCQLLEGSEVKVCTVIGFPLGSNAPEVKSLEAQVAQRDGADELDMVINVGALKSGDHEYVEQDIRAVVSVRKPGKVVKVILETALLSDSEIEAGCLMAKRAGADFVKTSTGFSSGGATATDVALMRRVVGDRMGVKASGGVRDADRADLMVRAGANRIGASASVEIVSGSAPSAGGY